jgi:N-methylhydantoinase A
MLTTDLRYELVRTHIGEVHSVSRAAMRRIFARMEKDGRQRLSRFFRGPVRIHRALDMRYGEQIFEINVSLDGLDPDSPDLPAQVVERFHRRHEEMYTYSLRDQEVVLVNARVAVIGELPELPEEPELPRGAQEPPARPRTMRQVFLDRWRQVPIFDLNTLEPGQTIKGPAIVEAATTTVLLRRGERATVTSLGWLDISVG